ncbi:MAG TPA: hypothetical protein VFY06_09235, partial [Verrucomicrobiae bacterium]|nr:hypothetical protein [Verrucomicrobiae bacterium]
MRIGRTLIQAGLLIGVMSFVSGTGRSQGTMNYLSNLGQPSAGGIAVGSNSWVAAGFRTGNNPQG